MATRKSNLLQATRKSLDETADRYASPRSLEADLDILASALQKLSASLPQVPQHPRATFGLCDVLDRYFEAGLVSRDALDACQSLEELASESDYDITDEEKFKERVSEQVATLKEAIDAMLRNLETDDE